METKDYLEALMPKETPQQKKANEDNIYLKEQKAENPEYKKVIKKAQNIIDSIINIGSDFFENEKYKKDFDFIQENWSILTQEQVDTFKDRVKEYLQSFDLSGYNIDLNQEIFMINQEIGGKKVFIITNKNQKNEEGKLTLQIYNGN